VGGTHTVDNRHDPVGRAVSITHMLGKPDGRTSEYEVNFYYSSLAELDPMAGPRSSSCRPAGMTGPTGRSARTVPTRSPCTAVPDEPRPAGPLTADGGVVKAASLSASQSGPVR
jgi:hypothetical protein